MHAALISASPKPVVDLNTRCLPLTCGGLTSITDRFMQRKWPIWPQVQSVSLNSIKPVVDSVSDLSSAELAIVAWQIDSLNVRPGEDRTAGQGRLGTDDLRRRATA